MTPKKKIALYIVWIVVLLLIVKLSELMTGNPAFVSGPGTNPKCVLGSRTTINQWKYMEVIGVESYNIQGKKTAMCCADIKETILEKGGGIETTGKFCEGVKDGKTCKILFDDNDKKISESCE